MHLNQPAQPTIGQKQPQNIWHRIRKLVLGLGAPACIVGPATVFVCDILSIILTRKLNPFNNTISEYALGPFGWLEKIGILLISVSILLVGLNLADSAKKMKSRILTIAGIMFAVVAIGFLIISIFNTDVTKRILSLHGFIHIFSAIAVALVFPITLLLLSFKLARHLKFKALAGYTAFTGLIGLGAAIWIAFPSNRVAWIGLSERLLAGSNFIWVIIAGSKTLKVLKAHDSKTPAH